MRKAALILIAIWLFPLTALGVFCGFLVSVFAAAFQWGWNEGLALVCQYDPERKS